jgi:hypothetical protein
MGPADLGRLHPQLPRKGGEVLIEFFERLVSHMHDATPSPLRGGLGRGETKQDLSIPLNLSTSPPRGLEPGPSLFSFFLSQPSLG